MIDKDKQERKGGLGKGIHSLLGGDSSLEAWAAPRAGQTAASSPPHPSEAVVRNIDPELIDPNPEQPRKVFHEEDLRSLAASIAQDGVIQPLLVMASRQQPERYILIAGERRLRASKMAGLAVVPALIKELNLDDRLRLALIENIQRSDLNVIEEALAYRALITDYGLTQEQCALKVGRERSTVANALRILSLPQEIQEDLQMGRLTMGHAKALLTLDEQGLRLEARQLILKKHLSVRKAEQLCKVMQKGGREEGVGSGEELLDPDMEYIADNLRSHLRTKVKLAGSAQRGKIEISYFSSMELERLLGLIGHKL